MADSVGGTTRAIPNAADDDFGYVHRDSYLLEKALTSDVKSSSDNNDRTGSDVKRETEVVHSNTSGDIPGENNRSVGDGHPLKEDVSNTSADLTLNFDDDTNPKKGILKPTKIDNEISNIQNGSKTRVSVTGTLPKADKKTSVMKKMSVSKSVTSGAIKEELPQAFQVKYLGCQHARGLWGIKHTRRPVDYMVSVAKDLKVGTVLPLVKLSVTKEGVIIQPLITTLKSEDDSRTIHSIDTISYGVQDLVYTRVFSMIVVKDTGSNAKDVHPFECHAFVCESRHSARRLTYSLATAFQEYSKSVNAGGASGKEKVAQIKKRFAIDLRSPDEIEADLEEETEA